MQPTQPRVNIIHCVANRKGKGRNYELTRKTIPPIECTYDHPSYLLSAFAVMFSFNSMISSYKASLSQTKPLTQLVWATRPASLCVPNMLQPSEQRPAESFLAAADKGDEYVMTIHLPI